MKGNRLILKRGKDIIYTSNIYILVWRKEYQRIEQIHPILRKRTREKIYRGIEMCVDGWRGRDTRAHRDSFGIEHFSGALATDQTGGRKTFLCRAHGISKGSPGRKVFEIRWIPNKGGAAGIPETGACKSSPGHSGSATGISSPALLSPFQTFTAKIFRVA